MITGLHTDFNFIHEPKEWLKVREREREREQKKKAIWKLSAMLINIKMKTIYLTMYYIRKKKTKAVAVSKFQWIKYRWWNIFYVYSYSRPLRTRNVFSCFRFVSLLCRFFCISCEPRALSIQKLRNVFSNCCQSKKHTNTMLCISVYEWVFYHHYSKIDRFSHFICIVWWFLVAKQDNWL